MSPTRRINGVERFYEERGAGSTILFDHGYTGSHDGWEPVVPTLADRYRCIVMDARGAGDSERPAGGYSVAQYAADVIGMADALGLDRFTCVGHSMGGGIGMWLGLEHAHRLERLVLVAPIPADGIQSDPALHARAAEQRAAGDATACSRSAERWRHARRKSMKAAPAEAWSARLQSPTVTSSTHGRQCATSAWATDWPR
ncbi:MAG: alpha/beta hydrolase [Dehalococcoidia bacterium]